MGVECCWQLGRNNRDVDRVRPGIRSGAATGNFASNVSTGQSPVSTCGRRAHLRAKYSANPSKDSGGNECREWLQRVEVPKPTRDGDGHGSVEGEHRPEPGAQPSEHDESLLVRVVIMVVMVRTRVSEQGRVWASECAGECPGASECEIESKRNSSSRSECST